VRLDEGSGFDPDEGYSMLARFTVAQGGFGMKREALVVVLLLSLTTVAVAAPVGKVLEFSAAPNGTVTFSGQLHKEAGFGCKDCHKTDLFPQMKQGTVKITMAEIYAGKQCGVCHDGEPAFAAKGNCARCHRK
jgi:c(7)-type cytochrome triheme protein